MWRNKRKCYPNPTFSYQFIELGMINNQITSSNILRKIRTPDFLNWELNWSYFLQLRHLLFVYNQLFVYNLASNMTNPLWTKLVQIVAIFGQMQYALFEFSRQFFYPILTLKRNPNLSWPIFAKKIVKNDDRHKLHMLCICW